LPGGRRGPGGSVLGRKKGAHGGNMVSPVLNPMIKITNIVAILIIPIVVSIQG
jgi:Na+/H+-translocating membrane pyrophosphatase